MTDTLISDEDIEVVVQKVDSFYFLHLNVWNWNKATLKRCKAEMIPLLQDYLSIKKEDLIFAMAKDTFTLKFYKMILPYHYEQIVEDDGGNTATVVAWDLERTYGN